MQHLYLFTLEIVPLEVGGVYDELPSHLTLVSRFLSDLIPDELAVVARSVFVDMAPVRLTFGETIKLGPKKITAHMVVSPDEQRLHYDLRNRLNDIGVEYQYPEFTGDNHKPHVTERDGVNFVSGSEHVGAVAYLIEVVDKQRVVRAKFKLGEA